MFNFLKKLKKNKKGSYVQMILLLPVFLFLLVLIGTELDYSRTRATAENDIKTALRYVVREKDGPIAAAKLQAMIKTLGEEHNINYSYQLNIYSLTKDGNTGEYVVHQHTESEIWSYGIWKRGNILELRLTNVTSGIFNQNAEVCFMGEHCVNLFERTSFVTARMTIENDNLSE